VNKPSAFGEDWFKFFTGISEEEYFSFPDTDETLGEVGAQTESRYPLRKISDRLFFSEEQRPNIHVIGSSRQGKSFFLEWLMREDIRRNLGCCLLDLSTGGSTAYRLLSYCAERKKQNVLFIEPAHAYEPYKKSIGLSPFRYKSDGSSAPEFKQESVDTLMSAVRDLYSVSDPADTSRIERYLGPVFAALYDAGRPLSHAVYFTNRLFRAECDEVLSKADPTSQVDLKEALYTTALQYQNFQSTVSRLLRFTRGLVGKMFSVRGGVDWLKVVRDKWAVIVRLDDLDTFDARLLGTYIIAELASAKKRLNALMDAGRGVGSIGKYPPFYLYADEAYMFASQSLKNILDIRQKANFKVTLAHHYARQFAPEMYEAIKVNCDMTVQFYVRGRETRDDISKEMYGGDIDPEAASYANSNLSRQHAVIKIGKDSPVRTRLPDVPAPRVAKEQLERYILKLYETSNWYFDSDSVTPPSHESSEPVQRDPQHARPRKPSDRKATGKGAVPEGVRKRREQAARLRPRDEEPKEAGNGRPAKL
jgi:hypothetical protein